MIKKIVALCAFTLILYGCKGTAVSNASSQAKPSLAEEQSDSIADSASQSNTANNSSIVASTGKNEEEVQSFVNPSGKTLAKRILTPKGYKRIKAKKGSFEAFLRNYKLKPDGSPVLLYDGREKWNQSAHIAVFKLPIENEDLQQCADSIMRVYGEWRRGYSISVSGNQIAWVSSSKNDSSYDSFKRFMRIVFAYSGTLNMDYSSKKIKLSEARVGDIFVKGGSPGHVVMIADVCKNSKGKKAYLLAQGYLPAQEFQLLKNPLHEDDPWYYEEEIKYPLRTPEYSFDKGSLRRYK